VADQALDNAMLKELVEGAKRRVRRSRIKVVSPARKREAVAHLEHKLQVPQRRACKVINQPRSTQRYASKRPARDAKLAAELRRYAMKHPRRGYRMAAAQLRRQGMHVNDKRVARLWRQEGLRVPQRQHKRRRLGQSTNSTQRRSATQMNEGWSYDFVFDQTEDGRRLKWLPICDEFTRESVALEVERQMEAKDVVRVLAAAVAERGVPAYIRSDNGPEFIAKAVRKWSRLKASKRSTSSRAARGRTPTARSSTAACVTTAQP